MPIPPPLLSTARMLEELEHLATIGVWVWDTTGDPWWSPGARRMMEIDPSVPRSELSRVFFERVAPRDLEYFRQRQTRLMAGETLEPGDLQLVLPSGKPRWVRTHSTLTRDDAGKVMVAFGAFIDITAEKQAQSGTELSRWSLEEAQRVARVGTYLFHLSTGTLEWSSETRRLMGLTPDEPVTDAVAKSFNHPEDQAAIDAWTQKILAGQTPGPLRTRVRLRDGSVRLFEHSSGVRETPLTGERVLVGSSRDVTDQAQLEEQLRHSSALEAVGTLAAGVAHDVNNALTVLSGSLSLLERKKRGEDEQLLQDARRAVDQCAMLTQQLLAFARRQPGVPRIIDANVVVAELSKMLRRVLPHGIAIKSQAPPTPTPIRMDPAQLESALMNLAVNARDAMPAGGTLTFAVAQVAQGAPRPAEAPTGALCRVDVSDTGTGIPPEHLADIFRPYFTTKSASKGTGLGLASLFGAMKQNAGAVTVTSTSGQGTCFSLWLPLETGVTDEAPVTMTPVPAKAARTILVVDDMDLVRRTTARLLSDAGYIVQDADGGEAALEKLTDEVDLLLTDVSMPDMDGLALARAVRAQGKTLPIVFVTGYSDPDGDGSDLASLGEVLLKPFSADKLLAIVGRKLT